MVADRSLDEFVGSGSTPTSDDSESEIAESAEPPEEIETISERPESTLPDAEQPAADPDPPIDDAEPATATSAWHSDGASCERCGERTDRRWTDDGALVCVDCKTW